MAYSIVLFDFDHTLFDTDAAERFAFQRALGAVGIENPDQYFGSYTEINRSLWHLVERGELSPNDVRQRRFDSLNEQHRLDVDTVMLATTFLDGFRDGGDWYPGARELVTTLSSSHRLGLATNAISEVQRPRLNRLGATELFEVIAISTELGVSKPSPRFFELIIEQLGHPDRDDILMIGDSLSSDIAGGSASNIDTCWYNPRGIDVTPDAGRPMPTHIATSYRAISNIIAGHEPDEQPSADLARGRSQ